MKTTNEFDKELRRKATGTQAQLEQLAQDVIDMNYDDFTQGQSYEELAKRYTDKGKMAMDDTIGKVAARTGGIASSYATQAGQQAYGDWMTRLEDTARAMYDSERQEAMDRYALSKGVLDVNNAAEDRRLVLEDRLRKQAYEDEDRAASQKETLANDIYAAAYAGKISWPQFAERATALGLTKDEFMSVVKQAEQARADDLYDRNKYDTETTAENAQAQILTLIQGGKEIPNELITASGWNPLTIEAYKSIYANSDNEKPKVLGLNGEQVKEELESGNINSEMLSTYREKYGRHYGEYILENGGYEDLSAEQFEMIGDALVQDGKGAVADLLTEKYEEYQSDPYLNDSLWSKGKDGGWYIGQINDNATVKYGDEEVALKDLIDKYIDRGMTKKQAKEKVSAIQTRLWG